ncbi:MAG: hypothetical protein JRN20_00350 [Nitrososphaerota archaeon]|jgi:ABC-type transport system substrate-binding protein|nr:hypothetical protein [Nitrososphaerota archaeon]MDG6921698.1 hypothetical protein [Nitrososphaerota archaeon]
MKTKTVVIVGLAVAVGIILSLTFVSSASGYQVGTGSHSPAGYGMMRGWGYGGMMGGYGGMMYSLNGNSGTSSYGPFGYMGSMMYGYYSNFTTWCNQFMAHYFGQ